MMNSCLHLISPLQFECLYDIMIFLRVGCPSSFAFVTTRTACCFNCRFVLWDSFFCFSISPIIAMSCHICILTQTYGMSSLLLQLRLAKSSKTLFFNNYFLEIRALLETFFSRISFFLRIKSKNLITLFITVLFFYPAIKYFGSCDPNQIITASYLLLSDVECFRAKHLYHT